MTFSCDTAVLCRNLQDKGSHSSENKSQSKGAIIRQALCALLVMLGNTALLTRVPRVAQWLSRRRGAPTHPPSSFAHSHFELWELLVLLELSFPLLLRSWGFHLFHQVPVNHRKARFCQPGSRTDTSRHNSLADSMQTYRTEARAVGCTRQPLNSQLETGWRSGSL